MTLTEVCNALHVTKGELIRLYYGTESPRGIDSALPQGYVNANGLSYGNNDPDKNLFFMVTDCNTYPYKIVNMARDLPYAMVNALTIKAAIMIGYSCVNSLDDSRKGLETLRDTIDMCDTIIEATKGKGRA